MNKYKQYLDNSEYEFVPYSNNKEFAYGGENAQIEKQENSISPSGEFTQYNASTHEVQNNQLNPDGNVNMESGERIYSDRLKVPGTKKTFADLNKVNNTTKQDKILEDHNATSTAKSTAKLVADIKRQKSDRLFQEQEALKASKVQAYAKKMGLDIGNNFAMGGTKLPKYEGGGTSSMMKEYGQDPNYENFWRSKEQDDMYKANSDNDARMVYEDYQKRMNALPVGPVNPSYNPNANSPLLTPEERNAQNPIPEDGNFMEQMNATAPGFMDPKTYNQYPKTPSDNKQTDYRNLTESGISALVQNSGNIMDLAMTKFGKKYDKESATLLTPDRLNPSEAIAQANMEGRVTRNRLKDATGGNVGSYLSNLTAAQSANTMNKAKIYQDFENANVGTSNQFKVLNRDEQKWAKEAEQMNKARSEDIARAAVADIGAKSAGAYKDYKGNEMNQYSLDLISKMYPDYVYDKNKRGWYHKSTGVKLKPKGE